MQCGVQQTSAEFDCPSAKHKKFASAEVIENFSAYLSADFSADLSADFSADFSASFRKISNICGGKSADSKHCLRQGKSAQSAHCCWIKSRREFYGCPIKQQRSTQVQPVHIKRSITLREGHNTQANSNGVVCVCASEAQQPSSGVRATAVRVFGTGCE